MIPSAPLQRVLFVDDEDMILRAIARELRAFSDRFELRFASGGEEAIRLMREERFDILVTDMVMPGIDGATLLAHARECYPAMVRIVLSGHAEAEHAVRSVPFAHQRILKPWNKEELAQTLSRAAQIRALMGDELIGRCISQVVTLPSSSANYARLSAALSAPNASFASIAEVISADMAMSAKLLQLANSSFVKASRPVVNIVDAVRAVGLGSIREYLLSPYLNVFALFSAPDEGAGFATLGRHAMLTAHLAARLALHKTEDSELRARAFVAGGLHDIGALVLLTRLPELAAKIRQEAIDKDCGVEELESRHLGANHAEIGGYLLGLWGLPQELCDAVARHHEPDAKEPLVVLLQVANWLAREQDARTRADVKDPGLLVLDHDDALIANFGVKLAVLLAIANDAASELGKLNP